MALLAPAVVQPKARGGMSLDETMRDIRTRLDSERIEPVQFKTVVGRPAWGSRSASAASGRPSASRAVRVAAYVMTHLVIVEGDVPRRVRV